MIEMSLEGHTTKPYYIVGINDAHNFPLWFNLVMQRINPDVFYTNAPREIEYFESHGVSTREIPIIRKHYHGQVIREMILHGDDISGLIPEGTMRFMNEYNVPAILRELYDSHPDELKAVREYDRKRGILSYEEVKAIEAGGGVK